MQKLIQSYRLVAIPVKGVQHGLGMIGADRIAARKGRKECAVENSRPDARRDIARLSATGHFICPLERGEDFQKFPSPDRAIAIAVELRHAVAREALPIGLGGQEAGPDLSGKIRHLMLLTGLTQQITCRIRWTK